MKQIILHQDAVVGRWVCERSGGHYVEGTAIGLAENGILIAGVLFDQYNKASIAMHVAGEGKRWMTRQYLWMCFHYPFEHLKVKKIIGLVGEANTAARHFDEHLGFVLDAEIDDAHPDGKLLIYSMQKHQCRFLEKRYGWKKRIPAAST